MNLVALKTFKPGKTWIVLFVALAVGGLAAFGASRFLSGRLADIEARTQGKTVNLVVAKRDLPRGEPLSGNNLAVRAVPADFAQSGAVLPEQFGSVEGEVIAFDLKAGELLMWSMLEGKKVPTFSARVEPGRRAITVAVDEINSISGLLEPGDLIDMLVTLDRQGGKLTLPLLQGVKVMATGQRSADDPASGERRLYSTVTLDTDPQQAQTVVIAREAGRLTALLRNPQDTTPIPVFRGDLSSLLSPQRASPATETVVASVPVLSGGVGGRIPPEGLSLGLRTKARTLEQQARATEQAMASAAMSRLAAREAASEPAAPAEPSPTPPAATRSGQPAPRP
jgi:pilus assembly protein CpaB